MPWWEYSICLEWLESHVLYGGRYDLNPRNAKRFLGRLIHFYRFAVNQGFIDSCTELEKAHQHIVGGKKLNLVERIPYTGEEMWMTLSGGKIGRKLIKLKIYEFWLTLLYLDLGESWNNLLAEAENSASSKIKRAMIKKFRDKLKKTGYSSPGDLLYYEPELEDLEDARKWFYETTIVSDQFH